MTEEQYKELVNGILCWNSYLLKYTVFETDEITGKQNIYFQLQKALINVTWEQAYYFMYGMQFQHRVAK